ncbi:MAG: DUF4252 domain-containing protein [Prevotella sp.]|nr:DUF4252 domain-containing protein [Prevotella sp.]
MKKTLVTIIFLATCLFAGSTVQAYSYAQGGQQDDGIEAIFKQFKNEKNVTYLNLPKSLIKMGMKTADDKDAEKLAEQVDGIRILTLEDAAKETKESFHKRFNSLELTGYEPLVKANDDGEKVRILTKGNDKEIQSIIIFTVDDEDCTLIKIDGHINPADVDDIVEVETDN